MPSCVADGFSRLHGIRHRSVFATIDRDIFNNPATDSDMCSIIPDHHSFISDDLHHAYLSLVSRTLTCRRMARCRLVCERSIPINEPSPSTCISPWIEQRVATMPPRWAAASPSVVLATGWRSAFLGLNAAGGLSSHCIDMRSRYITLSGRSVTAHGHDRRPHALTSPFATTASPS